MEKTSISENIDSYYMTPAMAHRLARLERERDERWERHPSVTEQSLYWKASAFRHINHLLPGQSILELGSGKGYFTRQLRKVSEGQNPITSCSFSEEDANVERILFPEEEAADGGFELAVGVDILNGSNYLDVLRYAYQVLKPSGRLILFQHNVRNPLRWSPTPPRLPDLKRLSREAAGIGFVNPYINHYDFFYGPLARLAPRFLRNLSVVLENVPTIRHFSDSLLFVLQKPPRPQHRPAVSLCRHPELRGAFSVVIPCHNEEMNVVPLIEGLKNFYGDYLHEIIPVDDNSRDGTADVLRSLAQADPLIRPVFRKPPNGVGLAIADGLRAATGKYVFTMDCDFQHLLPEMKDMFAAVAEGYDVVVGSRFSRYSVLINYPAPKIIANRGFHLLAKWLLRKKFRDLTNNLKMMRRSVVDNLELTQSGFGANAETGLKPLLMGYSLKEVPISWINRTADMGTSSFRLMRVGSGYLDVLWALCKQTRFGNRPLPVRNRQKS